MQIEQSFDCTQREMLQQECDKTTQAVLWRRQRQEGESTQLYLCHVRHKAETGWVAISHDWPIQRMVTVGGNAGFCYPGRFEGNPRGCQLAFRVDRFLSVSPIKLPDSTT